MPAMPSSTAGASISPWRWRATRKPWTGPAAPSGLRSHADRAPSMWLRRCTSAPKMTEPIEALLFDFGGTLDADGIAWKERFYAHYRAEGLDLTPEAFEAAFFAGDEPRSRTSACRRRDGRLPPRSTRCFVFPSRCLRRFRA